MHEQTHARAQTESTSVHNSVITAFDAAQRLGATTSRSTLERNVSGSDGRDLATFNNALRSAGRTFASMYAANSFSAAGPSCVGGESDN